MNRYFCVIKSAMELDSTMPGTPVSNAGTAVAAWSISEPLDEAIGFLAGFGVAGREVGIAVERGESGAGWSGLSMNGEFKQQLVKLFIAETEGDETGLSG